MCMFFDEEIQTSMFYPTLHDVMLHVLYENGRDNSKGAAVRTHHPQTLFLHKLASVEMIKEQGTKPVVFNLGSIEP